MIEFIHDRLGRVEFKAMPAPPREFGSLIDLFTQVLEHERMITGRINALFELARAEKDYASEIRLQWFVTEQVEEEATASQVLEQLKAVGLQGGSVWYLDSRMAKRAAK